MTIIDRYISKLFLAYFHAGLLVFVTIFLAVDAMGLIVRYPNIASASFMRYYSYYSPEIIYQMLPVACLLATIFTISQLNKTNELIALFSSGMSLIRITLPILFWVTIIAWVAFKIGDNVLPSFTKKKNFTYYVEIKKTPERYSLVKTNKIWYRSGNMLFNIKTLNSQNDAAQGLTMYYFNDNWELLQMITSQNVSFKKDQWVLKKGSVTLFTNQSSFPLTQDFDMKTIPMAEDSKELQATGKPSDVLSVDELKRFIQKNKEAGLDTIGYEVNYHSKFGFAFTALAMSLIGIPFSLGRTRSSGIMMKIGICLAVILAYWTLYNSALTLGQHGQLPPIIAAWAANLILVGVSGLLILRQKK